jgi:thiamine kinase-like enzyme
MLAELQAAVHEASADALPDQRQWLAWRIKRAARLPEELRHAALRRLRELPAGRAFCHGDLHPDNILLSPGGPVIIDWDGSSQGDPLGDVAATSLMIRTGRPTPAVRRSWLLDAFRTAFHAAYMRHYSRLRPAAEAEVAAWRLPVAAARLGVAVDEEAPALLAEVRAEAAAEH